MSLRCEKEERRSDTEKDEMKERRTMLLLGANRSERRKKGETE